MSQLCSSDRSHEVFVPRLVAFSLEPGSREHQVKFLPAPRNFSLKQPLGEDCAKVCRNLARVRVKWTLKYLQNRKSALLKLTSLKLLHETVGNLVYINNLLSLCLGTKLLVHLHLSMWNALLKGNLGVIRCSLLWRSFNFIQLFCGYCFIHY